MKVFEEGRKAFHKGQLTNPYKADTVRYREWQYGFDQAYFENKAQNETND